MKNSECCKIVLVLTKIFWTYFIRLWEVGNGVWFSNREFTTIENPIFRAKYKLQGRFTVRDLQQRSLETDVMGAPSSSKTSKMISTKINLSSGWLYCYCRLNLKCWCKSERDYQLFGRENTLLSFIFTSLYAVQDKTSNV